MNFLLLKFEFASVIILLLYSMLYERINIF
jgi:hypothetical protein